MPNHTSSTIARLAALIGGAITGVILTEWIERKLTSKLRTRYDYDKNRYAQGYGIQEPITPIKQEPPEE